MYWSEFIAIAIAHLFAVASPGPDFALVLKQSVALGRTAGLWTSLGIASGILLHVSYCLLGVALLLSASSTLLTITKLLAAAYLLYLGTSAIRASLSAKVLGNGQAVAAQISARRLFITGFITNGLNPKVTLFFLALFTVVISQSTPLVLQIAYGIYMALATFLWFALLSLLLGIEPLRRRVLKAGSWFERIMGIVLIGLAVRLLWSLPN